MLQRVDVDVVDISRCSGGRSTGVTNIFMRGGRKSDIMDILDYHEL